MKKIIITVFFIQQCFYALTQTSVKTDYLNQPLPGNTPVLFAPGVVSDGVANRDFSISPEGDEIFYTIQQKDFISVVMFIQKKQGKWTEPEVAPFSGIYNDLEATFTADGNRIFFSSDRPLSASDSTNDYNIWYVDKKNDNWSEPAPLGSSVNSEKDEYYPSVAKSGNLYFTTQLETGKGKEDIVMCEWKNGQYQPPVSLPEAINSKGYEFNAFVDPDEQFIIFTGYARTDDLGKGDLYISTKRNGEWQPAVNLGKNINSAATDYCPFVSWDKKYLFFTSGKITYKTPFTKKQTISDLRKGMQSPGNGLDDIYWIRFDAINKAP